MTEVKADYDGAWKGGVEQYLYDFLDFFFSQIHAEIDWEKGFTFLDQELAQLAKESEVSKRYVDKLIKIWLLDGEETWLLVHLEIQSQVDPDFAKRMFSYHYRIFDRYDRQVISLAILGDSNPNWKPQEFTYEKWGCRLSLQFPVVKLLDYSTRWEELEQSQNPFAALVMAHLRTQATMRDFRGRLQWKLALTKRLYQAGYRREDLVQIADLLDRMMSLPPELNLEYKAELSRFEAEQTMAYTYQGSIARLQRVEFAREYIVSVLETRFGSVPAEVTEGLNTSWDEDVMRELHKQAITASSMEEFCQILREQLRSSEQNQS